MLSTSRAALAYFFTLLASGGQLYLKENYPEPRSAVFPKYEPVGITPEPVQARFHCPSNRRFQFILPNIERELDFDFLAGT